jgi:hypothetical protein
LVRPINIDIENGNRIDNSDKLVKKYYRRAQQTLNTEMKKNKVTAVNTFAVPFLAYSFGIVNRLRKETKMLDQRLESF